MLQGKALSIVPLIFVVIGASVLYGNQNTPAGSLSGSVGAPPARVDLTQDGGSDWIHWGLIKGITVVHRKRNGDPKIGDMEKLGLRELHTYENNPTPYTWTDGAPTASVEKTKSGLFTYGKDNGFQFSVPADKTARTLKVYAGVWGAHGKFEANLSDSSAPDYVDTSVAPGANVGITDKEKITNVVYTISYRAASGNQKLNVKFTNITGKGNVELQAATLTSGK